MEKEKILDRIQKLLARAQSSNEHEAALAASMAQDLMFEHKISEAELSVSDDDPVRAGHEITSPVKRLATWKSALANKVGKGTGCIMYCERGQNGVSIRMIGKTSDVQTVRYLYEYLVKEIERLAEKAWTEERYSFDSYLARGALPSGKIWKNNFRLGCVATVGEKLAAQRQESRRAAAENHSRALVVIDQEAEEIRNLAVAMGMRPAPRAKMTQDQRAFMAGQVAGDGISLGTSGPGLKAGAKRLKA